MKSLKKALLFIGMVVGAGFASGREITDYFLLYGEKWVYGILLSGILFFMYALAVTNIINKHNINSLHDYLMLVMGKWQAHFTEWVSVFFFCMMFFAMISAAGSASEEIFGLKFEAGVAFMLIACVLSIVLGINAIENISAVIVPLLIVGIILIGMKSSGQMTVVGGGGSIMISTIIYVSYNTMTAASVIAAEEKTKSKFDGIFMGLMCGVAMTVMGYFIGTAVLSSGKDALISQLPFAYSAKRIGGLCSIAYAVVFITAVYTTAVCDGVAAVRFVSEKTGIKEIIILAVLVLAAVMFSYVSFSDFVSKIYPVFGVAGILQLFYTIKFFLNDR